MSFRPLHDRVLVKRVKEEEKTKGGIIIPDTAKEKPMQGEVLAVGPGARNDKGDLWTKAANYHSRTPRFNAVYRADLMRRATRWADWLEARFVTLDVTKAGPTPSVPSHPATAARTVPSTPQAAPVAPARDVAMTGYVPRSVSFKIND